MPHHKRFYSKQKPVLYFDENFPQYVVRELKNHGQLKKYFKINSVYGFNNQNRDDDFQYSFCKKKGFVLVTLDHDFMNDSKYPIQKISGIIFIVAGKNQVTKIKNCLSIVASFLSLFPKPKMFMGDSKFQVSAEGCVMRGRDARTREIKTITISPGDTPKKVADAFHYFG